MAVWPDLDAVPGSVQDQLPVDPGVRLGDVIGGPLTDEGHWPGRWQRPHPVAQIPILRAAAETVRFQDQPSRNRPNRAGQPACIRGLPAIGELHADMQRLLIWPLLKPSSSLTEWGFDPEGEPSLNAQTAATMTATTSVRASSTAEAAARGNSWRGGSHGSPCGSEEEPRGASSKNPIYPGWHRSDAQSTDPGAGQRAPASW